MTNSNWHPLRLVSLASGLCLFALMVLSITTGANQQHFEVVLAPQTYATDLLTQASGLKWIVALDDVFIACYVTVSILFAAHLTGPSAATLRPWIVGMGVAAGVLDFVENHHILAMLHQVQSGGAPDPEGKPQRLEMVTRPHGLLSGWLLHPHSHHWVEVVSTGAVVGTTACGRFGIDRSRPRVDTHLEPGPSGQCDEWLFSGGMAVPQPPS